MNKKLVVSLILLTILVVILTACSSAAASPPAAEKIKIGLVLDTGGEDDKGFNQYALAGARQAAEAAGIETTFLVGDATDFEASIETVVDEDMDLVITVGFLLGDATAKAARKHPDLKFAIVDNAYFLYWSTTCCSENKDGYNGQL